MSFIERSLAKYYAKNGFDILIPISLDTPIAFNELTPLKMDRGFVRPLIQMKLILEKIKNYDDYFAMGSSQGGIRSISLISEIAIFNKAFVFVAGGNFPLIYAQTEVESLIEFRKNHMKYLKMDDPKKYQTYLEKNLVFDPLKSCKLNTTPIYFFVADDDTSVPTKAQRQLYNECSKYVMTEIQSQNIGHTLGVLMPLLKKRKILKEINNSL